MPITYDITKDKLYLRGKREGKEEEKERTGKKIEATQRGMIERMLITDQLTDNQIAEIAGVSVGFVQKVRQSMSS